VLLILSTFYAYLFSDSKANKIHELRGFSILNAWAFFNKRYDFLRSNFDKTGHDLFSFKVLQHQIVAMSGEEARKTFFNGKGLNFVEGYRLLMGGSPELKDIKVETEDPNEAIFNKRLLKLLRRERLQDVIPTLFGDINKRMELWGAEGKMDPFKDIYDLVFQMTVRMASCGELAADSKAVKNMSDLYWKLEKSATPVGLLLPRFPGTAKKNKEEATTGLYVMLSHYVDIRRKAEVPNSDAIDILIADGDDNTTIISFVLSIVFAGVVNTGMISCWTLLYLGANDEWKQKAIAEVQNLISAYTNTTSSEPLHRRLSSIPISAWEDEMPVIEGVIRETLRLVNNGAALRRNLGGSIQVDDKTIDNGAFMAYVIGDVHLNEKFYTEPFKFDPDRFSAPREEDKRGYGLFLGWGAGRHPCTGMKVAKLEIKMILALVLSRYEYNLVNASGERTKTVPKPDRNDIHQSRPMGEPCFLQYRKIGE
jgi:sterol 14-demethylase